MRIPNLEQISQFIDSLSIEQFNNFFAKIMQHYIDQSSHKPYYGKHTDLDTEYYVVTDEDAELHHNDVAKFNFLVSLIRRAAQDNNFEAAKEAKQFIVDFPRASQVLENGNDIKDQDPKNVLERWSSDLAETTNLPKHKIAAIISTLNQGACYGAAASIMRHPGKKGPHPLIFSSSQNTELSSNRLERNGSVLKLYSTVPLHALVDDPNQTNFEMPDPNKPDVMVRSTVTIDFDRIESKNESGEISFLSDAVTQISAVQTLNPDPDLQPDYVEVLKEYSEREEEGFQIVLPSVAALRVQA